MDSEITIKLDDVQKQSYSESNNNLKIWVFLYEDKSKAV